MTDLDIDIPGRRGAARFLAVAAVSWGVVVAVMLAGGVLLTNDGPCHLFAGWVHANIKDPELGFADFFLLHLPPTSRGFLDVFSPLYALAYDWKFAYVVTQITCTTAWIVGGLLVANALTGRSSIAHLIIVFCSLQTAYYLGFFPFILGGGLAFVGLGLWMKLREHLLWGAALAAACFFLAARCHVFVAALIGVLLAADALSRGRRTTLVASLVGLPVVWVLVETWSALPPSAGGTVYVDGWERFAQLPDAFIPGPFWKTWPPLLLVLAGFAQGRTTPRRAMLIAGLIILVAGIALPRDFLGWQFGGWRFLPVAAVVGWSFLPAPSSWAGRGLLALIAASQLGWSLWFHLDQHKKNAPLLAAMEKIPPSPLFRYPIIRIPHENIIYQMSAHIHLGQMVTMFAGGASYYGHHSSPAYHAVLLKDGPVIPAGADMSPHRVPGDVGDDNMALVMTRAARFDGIIYYGHPTEVDYLKQIGYEVVFQEAGLIVANLVGCPLTINVDNATSPVTVSVGFEPGREPVHEFTLVPDAETTTYSHTIERLPCGERWVKAEGANLRCDKVTGSGANLGCTLRKPSPGASQEP